MADKLPAGLFEAAYWYEGLKERTNDTFMPLYFDKHRILVLKGGGGSGKSIFAGQKILERVTTEPNHRWLVCRKVAKTLRESCFQQLKDQAYELYPNEVKFIPRGKGSDMYILFENGSEIIFAGLDDVEKLKSIYNITGVWIEEASEITEADFNQLDIRLRTEFPFYLQMILTFNPISIQHWLKRRFFDRYDPRVRTHESTYKDNRFLIPESRETLESFKDTDEYYYQVYCLGMWGTSGRTVFDGRAINRRLQELKTPESTGLFEYGYDGLRISDIRLTADRSGCTRIYKAPEAGAPYVIGADTAGEGSDFFVAHVMDNRTGEQVAVLRGQFDEDVFAHQLYCLGRHYNTALIGIETNFSTYPVMELERLGYPKQYVRETIDDYTHKPKQSYGFLTNSKTRPVIIAELIKAAREDIGSINDETTLLEMLSFVRNPENLRAEAEPGAHDDCVMALAITQHIRPQQEYISEPSEGQGRKWTKSMWEDYENASNAEREMLIKKWGRPMR